jgi:hypothetical protein
MMRAMDVSVPKGPHARHENLVPWARSQLKIAQDIVDNPGGGLLFATQAMGQVRSALEEDDPDRWRKLVALLHEAEDAAVRRRHDRSRELIERVSRELTEPA